MTFYKEQTKPGVMPSRWETYGLVVIEALSSGRKLICFDIDGLQDHKVLGAEMVTEYSIICLSEKFSDNFH
jgi:hypothetical protein